MRAFYEAFSIGIAIFACVLFMITMGKAVAGHLAAVAVDRARRF